MPKVPVNISLDTKLLARVTNAAKAENRSRSNWIERTIERTLEAVSSSGSEASAQTRVVAPPSGAAPPVAPGDSVGYFCKAHPDSPVHWNDRIGAGAMVCSMCNRKATKR